MISLSFSYSTGLVTKAIKVIDLTNIIHSVFNAFFCNVMGMGSQTHYVGCGCPSSLSYLTNVDALILVTSFEGPHLQGSLVSIKYRHFNVHEDYLVVRECLVEAGLASTGGRSLTLDEFNSLLTMESLSWLQRCDSLPYQI
jgi:hypothetical protein